MEKQLIEGYRLYLIAESLAKDFSLFPADQVDESPIEGLLTKAEIERHNDHLLSLDTDAYIESVVDRANDQTRTPAPEIIRQLGQVKSEESNGPYYQATVSLDFGDGKARLIGFVAQDRSKNLGSWGPEHHLLAAHFAERCSKSSIPMVSGLILNLRCAKESGHLPTSTAV